MSQPSCDQNHNPRHTRSVRRVSHPYWTVGPYCRLQLLLHGEVQWIRTSIPPVTPMKAPLRLGWLGQRRSGISPQALAVDCAQPALMKQATAFA